MILMVVADAQGGIGRLQFCRSIVDDVKGLARGEGAGKIVDGRHVAGETREPGWLRVES